MARPSPSRIIKNIERGRSRRSTPQTGGVHLVFSCPVSWEDMREVDARTRHCARCDKAVHDLTHLSSAEQRAMVRQAEDQFCGQVSVRPDGTVVDGACEEDGALVRGGLVARR